MKNQIPLGLILTLSSLFPPNVALAQRSPATVVPPAPKQSHHPLPDGFDLSNAEEMMAQRLHELHELHQLQDQVQGMFNDPEFREKINQLSDSDLQKLREKMLTGKGLSQDRNWEHFLKQAASWQKWDQRQIDSIRNWAEHAEQKLPSSSDHDSHQDRGPDVSTPTSIPPPDSPSPPPSPPTTAGTEPTLFDRMQEESTKWLIENLDDVGGNVLESLVQASGNEASSPLADLLRSMRQADFAGMDISGNPLFPTLQSRAFTNSLSRVGDFLHQQGGFWDEIHSVFRNAPMPSLPNLRSPSVSVSTSSAMDDGGRTPALISLLLLATIVLLLYKKSLSSKSPVGSGAHAGWHLGPWPVPPGGVSSRQDVIRAFEHLALLCLGPSAAACHHRELAERLAEQGSDNPAHRQAAEMLAWLYEQARYAPSADALSQEQLSDARQALCLLAGVTAS
ncbi:MAG TPA: DUF4129 domain-containing protein [Gemmataceae bacterium]|nr:DUF4129 domain-containing protein [Gemmataceae bacterium]